MRYFRTQHAATPNYILHTMQEMASAIGSIDMSQLTFASDVYTRIAQCIDALKTVYADLPEPLLDNDFVTSATFQRLHRFYAANAARIFASIPECYARADVIAKSLFDSGMLISKDISTIDDIIENMQSLVSNINMSSSVYEETVVYDTCDLFSLMRSGSLYRDVHAGCLILPVLSANVVPYTVESIVMSESDGTLTVPVFGQDSCEWISAGVVSLPTIGAQPVFSTTTAADDTSKLSDNDPLTMLYRERVSKYPQKPLSMTVSLSIDTAKLDAFTLLCANNESDNISRDINYPLVIRDVWAQSTDGSGSLNERSIDNRITVNGRSIGTTTTSIVNIAGEMYPGATVYTSLHGATKLRFTIVHERAQLVTIAEKILYNAAGDMIHRFNYPETLLLNGYQGDGVHEHPVSWYTKDERDVMYELTTSAATSSDELVPVYRHAIGLREISLSSCSYAISGEMISDNINGGGTQLASCELFVNAYIPTGTSIAYAFSVDKVTWFPVMPKNAHYADDDTLRIVFDPRLTSLPHDALHEINATSLYLRVTMTGDAAFSPILKAFAVRVKHL